MASCKRLFVYLLSVFAITLITEIGHVEGRGGRGGGGARGGGSRGGYRGGSRGSRGSGSRSRGNSISRSGSSPYTRSTFGAALTAGYIYGSFRYMRTSRYRSNPNELPTICTNNFDKDSNGTTYGYFICPRAGEPEDHEYCCGEAKREHCCEYYNQTGRIVGIIFGVLIGATVLSVLLYCCIKHFKEKKVDEKYNSIRLGSHNNGNTSTPVTSPYNSYPPTSTAFTTSSSENPYDNKPTSGDATAAYDDKTVPPYSFQPSSGFTYPPTSSAPAAQAAPAPIGFVYSDPEHNIPPPPYSQAVNQPTANI